MKFGPIEINPVELGSQGNAILGIRDSGKSYTATKLAEELYDAGVPFIAFDPIGVWRYMRVPGKAKGYPIVVAGGQEGDLPLSPASAPMIVEAAMKNGVSLVIDLFDINLSKADWKRIVRDCVRLLLHRNKEYGLRHIFLEEAAEFAPQMVRDGDVYAEIEKLARMGGNSRLGYTLVNQRAQELNKAVLELCDNLFLHRQKGKNALDSLKKWLELAGAAGGEVMRTLPTLPQGDCWAWMSSSDTPILVHVPEKNSLHPDRRLMHGDAGAVAQKAVSVGKFVKALEKTLPRLEEETKANDPKALRSEIDRLKRQIAAAERSKAPLWPDQRDQVRQLREDLGIANKRADALQIRIDQVAKAIGAPLPSSAVQSLPPTAVLQEKRGPTRIVRHEPRPAISEKDSSDGSVPHGCAKPLAALASAYPGGMTESQWATSAGYKKSGGTWCEYRRRLVRAGMIEQRNGLWHATELGAEAAGDVELPPPPGPDLARWWAGKIHGTPKLVEQLIESYPTPLSRDELADRIEMVPTGGSFLEYVRRLKRNNIAIETRDGLIALADEIMGR